MPNITEICIIFSIQLRTKWLHIPKKYYYNGKQISKEFLFPLALEPPWALASAFQFHDHFTDCRTPWTSDQLVARPLPKHRTTQTQNKHIHTPNIDALCGIRTHVPRFRTIEDST
jgi:hypothetical protein